MEKIDKLTDLLGAVRKIGEVLEDGRIGLAGRETERGGEFLGGEEGSEKKFCRSTDRDRGKEKVYGGICTGLSVESSAL